MGFVEKDYMMRYFNELGIVIAKVLGLKQKGLFDEACQVIDKSLNNFGMESFENYLKISEEDLIIKMKEKQKLKTEQFSVLAELMFEKGDIEEKKGNKSLSRALLSRALIIYNYLSDTEKIYSFDREEKIRKIKSYLLT